MNIKSLIFLKEIYDLKIFLLIVCMKLTICFLLLIFLLPLFLTNNKVI